jgi:hypothetical protein
MKKILVVLMLAAMSVFVLAGCGGATETKTGLGNIISISKSTDAGEEDGLAQADVTMAAVTIDQDGKIVNVKIDVAQVKVNFDAEGKLTTDLSAELKTKVELGDDYNMKTYGGAVAEWYEQIASLEDWMTGKTIEEVKAMKTYEKDEAHPAVPDEADLKSSVTINVSDYIAAVEEAVNNAD